MGMFIPTFDPSLSLSNLILCFVFLLVFWRWLNSDSDQTYSGTSKIDSTLNKHSKNKLIVFFRNVLVVLYPIFIVMSLNAGYPVFNEKGTNKFEGKVLFHSDYLLNMTEIFIFQSLVICAACLLWTYAPYKIVGKVIVYGLYVIILGTIVKNILHFIDYPFFHWVQYIEFILTGLSTFLIPFLGIFFIKYKFEYIFMTDK